MAKNKEIKNDNVSTKKLNRQLIEQKLVEALADFRELTGKKRFEQSIKKAGKLIHSNFPKKAFEKFREKQEVSVDLEKDTIGSSHTSINDLP